MENETIIDIVSKKAQCYIHKALKLNNINNDYMGKIEKLGDVVVSFPSHESICINRAFNLEKICMSNELLTNVNALEQHIEFAIRLVILMINEELRVECPRKFAGQVVVLKNSADGRNFCFVYGFGN